MCTNVAINVYEYTFIAIFICIEVRIHIYMAINMYKYREEGVAYICLDKHTQDLE